MVYVGLILAGCMLLLLGGWAIFEILFACKICIAARSSSEFWKWAWGDAAAHIGGIPFAVLFGVPAYIALAVLLPLLPRKRSLHRALAEAQVPLVAVQRILAADPGLVNERDQNGQTPLHVAAWKRSDRAIEMLLAAGADPHAQDNQGSTALDLALSRKGSFVPQAAERKIALLQSAMTT